MLEVDEQSLLRKREKERKRVVTTTRTAIPIRALIRGSSAYERTTSTQEESTLVLGALNAQLSVLQ